MAVLRRRHYERILDLVTNALTTMSDQPTWPSICADIVASLGATAGGVFDIDRPGGPARPIVVTPYVFQVAEFTPRESAAHPLVHYFGWHRERTPRTLDEVPDHHRWRTSPAFEPARIQFAEADQQLAIGLPRAGSMRILAVARHRSAFATAELAMVARVQPLIAGLDAHLDTIARWRAEHGQPPSDPVADHRLTPRELSVLVLLAEGRTVAAIGRRLAISPRTVTKHQENVQRKLGTTDRLNTILRAQALGIVRPPVPQAAE